MLIEHCCDPESMLSKVAQENSIAHVRACANHDASNQTTLKAEVDVMAPFKFIVLFISLPCTPWSRWMSMNLHRLGPDFAVSLQQMRNLSLTLLRRTIVLTQQVLDKGGLVFFEWPRYCDGWSLPDLKQVLRKNDLHGSEPDGCRLGVQDSMGNPIIKPQP